MSKLFSAKQPNPHLHRELRNDVTGGVWCVMTPATASGVKQDDFSAGMLMNSPLVARTNCVRWRNVYGDEDKSLAKLCRTRVVEQLLFRIEVMTMTLSLESDLASPNDIILAGLLSSFDVEVMEAILKSLESVKIFQFWFSSETMK